MSASILAVLVVLTVIDEDVLNVEHVFTIATIAGNIVLTHLCNILQFLKLKNKK